MKETIMKLSSKFPWFTGNQISNDDIGKKAQTVSKSTMGYLYDESDTSKENMAELIPPTGLEKFRNMRFNDPVVGGLMLRIENIFKTAGYTVEGENADFIIGQLKALPKGVIGLVQDMASALTYGFSINEKIWKSEGGVINLKDVAPRHQLTIVEFLNDEVVQSSASMPLSKCIHFVPISICRNPLGVALLRQIYKPYYYKSSIEAAEAQGIDRELGGLPMMTAPEHFEFIKADPEFAGYDPVIAATLDWAKSVVRDVRRDSSQGIITPAGWVLSLLQGKSSTGHETDLPIARLNTEIGVGLLENFAVMGAFSSTNSSDMEGHIKDFRGTCDAWLALMADTINRQLIRDMCFFNNLKEIPVFAFNKVDHESLMDMTAFLARLCQLNVVTPTTELETKMLNIAGLPLGTNVKKIFSKADLVNPDTGI